MVKATWKTRWTNQTPHTRIAVSAALAIALMLASNAFFTYCPSLIEVHARLYSHFETREALQDAIVRSFVVFAVLSQIRVALACASESRLATREGRPEDFQKAVDQALLYIFGFLLFAAVLGLSWFAPDFFIVKDPSNWPAVGMIIVNCVVFAFLIGFAVINSPDARTDNPVSGFAIAKSLICVGLFLVNPNTITFAMMLGMCLLDYLLNVLGKPLKAPADMPVEETAAENTSSPSILHK